MNYIEAQLLSVRVHILTATLYNCVFIHFVLRHLSVNSIAWLILCAVIL